MNLDENGLITEEKTLEWGKWLGNSIANQIREETRDEVKEEVGMKQLQTQLNQCYKIRLIIR